MNPIILSHEKENVKTSDKEKDKEKEKESNESRLDQLEKTVALLLNQNKKLKEVVEELKEEIEELNVSKLRICNRCNGSGQDPQNGCVCDCNDTGWRFPERRFIFT